uniref:E3 ubiquitin-protein ligase n=1 Tax=Anopheles stephensi TaxID=30069 RepID=A0A182YCW1_ANOST
MADGRKSSAAEDGTTSSSGGGGTTDGSSPTARKPLSVARLKEKGKKLASAHIHRELAVNGTSDSLNRLLDDLLSPETPISNSDNIEWCRWLVAGGRTPAEFASIVRAYDNHAKCGLVWIPHVVAYRCRTCGISPCMSICRDCFKRGNHRNHDFNMFLSQAGGACDCGDTSVMKAEGFCSDHGLNNCQNKSPVPDDLMLVAEAMMPRLILRMLLHFREYSATNLDSADCRRTAEYCNEYCAMLMEFNNMGELMRRVMTRTLIDRGVYRRLQEPPYPSTRYGMYLRDSWLQYEEALRQFPSPEPPLDYAHLAALGRTIVHETLLEEFIFWTFKYEFQQQIVCFLLNMLPDQDYKEHLTRTFVMHYCRIPSVLELSSDPDTLSNRVVHMSVQLFSNESLALKMVEELSLLHVMIISLRQMMSKILTPHTLHSPEHNFHYVVDCAERVMKEHCYWPLVSDFNNVLSHESVALVFLKDDDLIDMWFQFLSMLQGMNVNIREIISHVEYESSSYYAAFSCELEASAYPMWSIISHLQDPSHAPLAKKIMMYCVNYLQDWLDAINFYRQPTFGKFEMGRASFHFPLHRYLAAFICQAVKTMGMSLNDILPSADLLPKLMMHPLRVQVSVFD